MAESTWADPNFQSWAKKNNYVLAKGETEEFPDLKVTYNVVGTPTVLVYNPKGEHVDRMLGYVPTAELVTTADNYQKGIGTLGSMLAEEKDKASDAAFIYKLGGRLMAWNRLDDADMRFATVVKIDPENKSGDADNALLDRAWAARKKENWDAAVAHAKDCYNRWPTGEKAAEAWIYVAYYSEKGGKKDDAIAAYKEYLKKWPQGEDAEFAKEQLAELEKPVETTPPGQGGSQ